MPVYCCAVKLLEATSKHFQVDEVLKTLVGQQHHFIQLYSMPTSRRLCSACDCTPDLAGTPGVFGKSCSNITVWEISLMTCWQCIFYLSSAIQAICLAYTMCQGKVGPGKYLAMLELM